MENKELLELLKSEVLNTIEKSKSDFISKADFEEQKQIVSKMSTKEDLELLNKSIEEMSLDIKKNAEKTLVEKESLIDLITKHSEVLKSIKNKRNVQNSGFSLEFTKSTMGATDIGSRDYLGTIESGIEKKAVRRTAILDLFPIDNVNSEYIHYWEQDVVTRDAKFVIACATSTHLTKQTWVKRTVELAKVRDMVDICLDMLEDYSFVESELRALVFESIQLKKESELLLGLSATSTDMLSINSISSEFLPSNALAPFNGANGFKEANLEQLIDAMSAQIYVFGAENKFMTDTVIMNYSDFVRFRNLKSSTGDKLINVFNNIPTIAGHTVVTSPLVAPNTLYILDSTKGRIKQRKGYTANLSYENKDNIEHELATLVAYERVQFFVKLINRNAFMKCSNITTALTAITKP